MLLEPVVPSSFSRAGKCLASCRRAAPWVVLSSFVLAASMRTSAQPSAAAPTRGYAPADLTWIAAMDVAAMRDSEIAEEIEAAYLLAIPFLEGSLAAGPEPAVRIDALLAWEAVGDHTILHAYGRFSPAFERLQRGDGASSRAPMPFLVRLLTATGEATTAAAPTEGGASAGPTFWLGLRHARACDETHWILGDEVPAAALCAVSFDSASGEPAFDASRADGPVVITSRTPSLLDRYGIGGAADLSLVVRLDGGITGSARARMPSAAAATELATRYRDEYGPEFVAPLIGEWALEFGAIEPRGTLARADFHADLPELRTAVLALFGSRVEGADDPPDTIASFAPEPHAELEAFRASFALHPRGLVHAASSAATPATPRMPIVSIGGDERQVAPAVEAALIRAGLDVYSLAPPDITPGGHRIWTTFGPRTRAWVSSALRSPPENRLDPCATGCVLVGSGSSADLVLELAALEPERYRAVLIAAPARALPFEVLGTVATFAPDVPVLLVAVPQASPAITAEVDAYRVALARLTSRVHETSLDDVGFAALAQRATELVETASATTQRHARARGRVLDEPPCPTCRSTRRGAVATPSLEASALGCFRGDATSCHATSSAWVHASGTEVPTNAWRNDERACAMGDAAACASVAAWYRDAATDGGRDLRMLMLHAACEGGSGEGCNELGMAYIDGVGVPVSRITALAAFGRACASGLALGCRNVEVELAATDYAGAPVDVLRETLETVCAMNEWSACVHLSAYGLGGDTEVVTRRLVDGCDHGHVPSCLKLADRLGVSEIGDRALARACVLEDESPCDAELVAPASRRVAASGWVPAVRRACAANDRHACATLARLAAGGLGPSRRERVAALDRACQRGDDGACGILGGELAATDVARARALLERGCGFGADDACDALDELDELDELRGEDRDDDAR